ncbi:MAG: hypothetical protein FWD34_10245 [Oscillospiraceae bacterium]|nr:hypothetical protein [Oscillospiraceae bacterium]
MAKLKNTHCKGQGDKQSTPMKKQLFVRKRYIFEKGLDKGYIKCYNLKCRKSGK